MLTVNKITKQGLELWISEEKSVIEIWVMNNKTLTRYVESILQSPLTQADLAKHPVTNKVRHYIYPLVQSKGYNEFFIISPQNINIASMRDEVLGQKSFLLESDDVLARVLGGETVISLPRFLNMAQHDPDGGPGPGLATMFITAPIYNEENKIIALISFGIDPRRNFSRLLQFGRVGESGETYAFNRSAKLISESRFGDQLKKIGLIGRDQSVVLNVSIRNPGVNLLEDPGAAKHINLDEAPLTLMAEKAISGVSGYYLDGYQDYRGVTVVGVWKWNDDLGFGIATEIDFDEVFHSIKAIKYAIIAGAILNIFLIVVLIIKFTQRSNIIKRQSLEDGLTGLANRRMLDMRMEMEFVNSSRNSQPLSVCMIDIDHFKLFNDRLGHLAGDDALKMVSKTIKSTIKRKGDLVARFGGEEFCVVLPNTSIEAALVIAEEIRLCVVQKEIPRHKDDEYPWVTISLGVACIRKNEDKCAQDIITRADKALYVAKRDGRNCVRTCK